MKPFFAHSTKYDGSLHYRFPAFVVREESNLLVLFRPAGTRVESYRGLRMASYNSLEWYWSDRHYNLLVEWHSDWQPYMHYINIATPASWDDGTLRYIDLDLDVIWRARTGDVLLDDEDEFALHQVRFAYPADLIARCWQARDAVCALIAQRTPPFDGRLYDWRPHGLAT